MTCPWKCGDCCQCLSPVPDGCSTCVWFEKKCKWLIDRKGNETHCDWIPSRYAAAANQKSQTVEADRARSPR